MYAVIFRAEIHALDERYEKATNFLRDKAFSEYGCVDFSAVSEGEKPGDLDIAISYWHSLEDIQRWRDDVDHADASAYSHGRWYRNVRIDVVDVLRSYQQSFEIIDC
ncbi:hypothetical protein NBRC116494_03920 [Aurantivibrio plasticivorans]